MYLSLTYKVTFKESAKSQQMEATFPKLETANAFALAVEKEGGIAIVTSSYVKTVSLPTDFPIRKG